VTEAVNGALTAVTAGTTGAAAGNRAADSRTKITATALDSHANPAGNTRTALSLHASSRRAACSTRSLLKGDIMATSKSTFQKRQKEMKRQEKQRMKAERRAQKKLEGPSADDVTLMEPLTGPMIDPEGAYADPDPEN
jgi:hypothetical protein